MYKICALKDGCPIYKKWKKELGGNKNQNVIHIHNTTDAVAKYFEKKAQAGHALGKASVSKLEHHCVALDGVNLKIEKENSAKKDEDESRKGYESCGYLNGLNANSR